MKADPRVDTYLAEAEPFAQPILRRLRKLVRQGCPQVEETLKWNMPAYVLGKKILLITPSFKAHCRCVFWSPVVQSLIRRELGRTGRGLELLGRITGVADLPPDRLLLRYIRAAVEQTVPGTKAPVERKTPAPRAPRPPPDLVAALKTNATAARTFANFSPSCRREYMGWITEAKRPETRAKRLATTVQWLAQGKRRNWKHERPAH
jgi:uncharacterized protein YdeI (YjbR/CyaY-like superfamily)